ncbi:conserved hypothetical protein [Ricinus communis]|uniref:Uncharacterized protein n=1 Tax=Ricinus communis TaxID=3988 RepID=B9T6P3_RICCO|nr:conserved hypothetical protein [Ricinus communis]
MSLTEAGMDLDWDKYPEQKVKARADELALLGSPFDDLSDKILEALGDDNNELARAVQAKHNPISSEKLQEKLLNFEASLITHKQETLFSHYCQCHNSHHKQLETQQWQFQQ